MSQVAEYPAPTTVAALREAPQAGLPAVNLGFFNLQGFELLQRVARAFAASDLVPKQYQNNMANCMIALDMAQRINANPLMVMQNLYIVHGTPGWSSKFLIATINVCGRFNALRYEWRGKPGDADYGCRAWTIERATGERLDGIWVDWKMVKAEGWSSKNGSKWNTMPDQMFIYRAAAFWQRGYAPELGMGLQTSEELYDTIDAMPSADGSIQVDVDALRAGGQAAAGGQRSAGRRAPAGNRAVDPETGEVLDAPALANDASPTMQMPAPSQAEPVQRTAAGQRATNVHREAKAEAGKPAPEAAAAAPAAQADAAPTFDRVANQLRNAKALDTLELAADLIREVEHAEEREDLHMILDQRRAELERPAATQQPTGGRQRRAGLNLE